MSEFEKELDKLGCTAGRGSKFFAETMLKRNFGYWVSSESHEKIVQQVSALTIENEKLKADKPPVVVPQFVAGWFEEKMSVAFSEVVSAYSFSGNEAIAWVYENGGIDLLCKMKLYGYTVEKEKLYLLKHIDFCKTDKDYDWFMIKFSDGALNHLRVEKGQKPATIDCRFTQSEIDDMEVGSYEQIEVG